VKYLLMIYANQQTWEGFGADDWARAIADQEAFNATFVATGELLDSMEVPGSWAGTSLASCRGLPARG